MLATKAGQRDEAKSKTYQKLMELVKNKQYELDFGRFLVCFPLFDFVS